MAASAAFAAYEAMDRLIHPRDITGLGWVAAAGVVGFIGNEVVARYRITIGRQIGSAGIWSPMDCMPELTGSPAWPCFCPPAERGPACRGPTRLSGY